MRVPSYRLHKSTGQAIVVIKRKFYYLGKFGTEESRRKYEKIIGEYLANGRKAPSEPTPAFRGLTVRAMLAGYLEYCRDYYHGNDEYRAHAALVEKVVVNVGDLDAQRFSRQVKKLSRTLTSSD